MTTNTLSTPVKIFYSYGRGHKLENWYFYLCQEHYHYLKNKRGVPSKDEYVVFREDFEKFLESYEKKIKTLKLRKKILNDLLKNGFEPFKEFELFKSRLERYGYGH